jgi:hypothetical protein
LPVNNSAWSNSIPSGASSIRHGDDEIRSTKSFVQNLIDSEHYFNLDSASSASGGVHRQGSARIFVNATRASLATPASADSKGRLAYCEDTESLHYLGTSSHSTLLGGSQPYGAFGNVVFAGGGAPSNFASGSTTSLNMDGVGYEVGDFFDVGTPSRFNVASTGSGRYLLTANVQFKESVHSGAVRRLAIRKNGLSTTLAEASGQTLQTGSISLSCSAIDMSSSTTHWYEAVIYHDAGVSLNSSHVSFNFAIAKL